MKWLSQILILSMVCGVSLPARDGWPGLKKLPLLQGARLLVGYPPDTLVVTSTDNVWELTCGNRYLGIHPTMSRDGTLIATARIEGQGTVWVEDGFARSSLPLTIATYSLQDEKWTSHMQLDMGYGFASSIAIAPDASKLAFAVAEWDGRNNPVAQVMHVIDVKSGEQRRYPIKGRHKGVVASWSPDGRYLVYDTHPKRPYEGATEYSPEVLILNLETGESRKLATGNEPAWSPSGDWIAYYYSPDAMRVEAWLHSPLPPSPTQVWVVRPDGTGARRLTWGKYFMTPPVWSPDSSMIMLSAGRNYMTGTVDVKIVDIATGRTKRVVKGGPPVYGWGRDDE